MAKSSLSLADLLGEAVPAATEREIEHALASLKTRNGNSQIKNMRAYLRKIIREGDAPGLVADAGAELAERDRNQARQAEAEAGAETAAARQDKINAQAADREPHDPERVSTILADLRADLTAKAQAKKTSETNQTETAG